MCGIDGLSSSSYAGVDDAYSMQIHSWNLDHHQGVLSNSQIPTYHLSPRLVHHSDSFISMIHDSSVCSNGI